MAVHVGSRWIVLREPLGLLRDLLLGVRDLGGEPRKLAGQLPVTPPVDGDLPAQPPPLQLQLWGHAPVYPFLGQTQRLGRSRLGWFRGG